MTTSSTPPSALTAGGAAPAPRGRVPWGAVALFTALAYGLAWLAALPLWLDGGLTNPSWPVVTGVVMVTPALAALLTVPLVARRGRRAHFLGLVPVRPWRRLLRWGAVAMVLPIVLGALALLLAAALGLVPLEVTGRGLLIAAASPLLAVAIAVLALGEELGWRGFLLAALEPLGTWPAMVVSGVVWGVWHAPLVLLGYNYRTTSPVALVWMAVAAVLIGVVLAWLRLRSGSVWASCVGHGALNASSSLLLLGLAPAAQGSTGTLLWWPGWLVLAATTVVLLARSSFRWAEPVSRDAHGDGRTAAVAASR